MTSSIQIIQTLRRKAGMDDDTYRDFLERETGKRSTKDLNEAQSGRVIAKLRVIVPYDATRAKKAKTEVKPSSLATGAFASKLRALWLTAYNLGLVQDYRDTALIAFVQRQTGVSHTRFLIEPLLASKAIEGIKAIIVRSFPDLAKPLVDRDPVLIKRAVASEQKRILIQACATAPEDDAGVCINMIRFAKVDWIDVTTIDAKELDKMQAHLGQFMRALQEATANHGA